MAIKPSEQFTPSTLHYGASTTKAQLCAAWVIYINSASNQSKGEEKVTLTTPIAKIIPQDFVLQDEYTTNHVTIEDCLSHRTGYSNHQYSFGRQGIRTAQNVTRNLRHLPPHTELRTNFEYCNLMYMAASYALEHLTGKSLSQILHDTLWDPLGMTDTYAGYGEAAAAVKEKDSFLAKCYSSTKIGVDEDESLGQLHEEHYMDFPEFAGAGYVISTADDYARWMRCMLDRSHPLSAGIVENLLKPRAVVLDAMPGDGPVDGFINYCLGWFTASYRGHQIFWNPGLLVGGGASVMLVPELKWGVTFFSNGTNSTAKMKSLSYLLLDQLIGTPSEESGYMKSNELVVSVYKQAVTRFNTEKAKIDADASSQVQFSHPLERYAGTYNHSGYGSVSWTAERDEQGPYLRLELERTWPGTYIMRPLNADRWLGIEWHDVSQLRSIFKAQTRIGVNGQPQAIGIAIEPSMPDTLIWFTKM